MLLTIDTKELTKEIVCSNWLLFNSFADTNIAHLTETIQIYFRIKLMYINRLC